jgi:hypothetical protein
MKFDCKPLQREVAEIGYIAATRRFVPVISKLTRRDRSFGGAAGIRNVGRSRKIRGLFRGKVRPKRSTGVA